MKKKTKCFRCGKELTDENRSDWEVFTGQTPDNVPKDCDYLGPTAEVCKECHDKDSEIGLKMTDDDCIMEEVNKLMGILKNKYPDWFSKNTISVEILDNNNIKEK